MPPQKKSAKDRGPSISAAYLRIIPLVGNGAYIQTTDALSVKVAVGSKEFFTLLAEYVATPAAPMIADHCTKLAVDNPSAAEHWNTASKMLSVDEDGNPLITFDTLIAELFPSKDHSAEVVDATASA